MRQSPTAPSPSPHKADFKLIVMYFAKSLRTLKIDRRILKNVNKGLNSIRAYKLSAIVASIKNRKEAFISILLLRLCSSSLRVLFDDVHFSLLLTGNSSIFLEVESMKAVQMFFEDSVASHESVI